MENTQKQRFQQRFAQRYADLNLNDENNYYERANELMDDYEHYESASKNLLEALDGNEELMEMLTQACIQQDFDPVVWMVEQRGLDLQEAMKNPDYASIIAKAHSKYIEEEARRRDIDNEMKQNLPKSLEAIDQRAKELGIDDETKKQLLAQLWQMGEDMMKGILSPELFEDLAIAANYEQRIQEATEKGREEGLNIRIEEHLRKVHAAPLNIPPTQTPINPSPNRRKTIKNPFVDADWN